LIARVEQDVRAGLEQVRASQREAMAAVVHKCDQANTGQLMSIFDDLADAGVCVFEQILNMHERVYVQAQIAAMRTVSICHAMRPHAACARFTA
jgi:hypothetical protein